MTAVQYIKRWSDLSFLSEMRTPINNLFSLKIPAKELDLRGLIVGLEGSPISILSDFQNANIENSDLSFLKCSCSFSRANIQETKFTESFLDTCRFKSTIFIKCSFNKTYFNSPIFDDAKFLNCSFIETKLAGKGINEYGGRRFHFVDCEFSDVLFQNLHMRACIFRNCIFKKTLFKKCIFTGSKFEGYKPPIDDFINCEI